MISFKDTIIKDVKIITPTIYSDDRGYFFESYNSKLFSKILKKIIFNQDNESKSKFGTLRGIHFQKKPFEQSKLIRVIKGKIQDVAIDLRSDSPTFKKYVSVILDDKNKNQLFVPKGCGHAFLTLSNEAIVSYKVDNFHSIDHDCGIKYDDPEVDIYWNLDKKDIKLSDKDQELPYL